MHINKYCAPVPAYDSAGEHRPQPADERLSGPPATAAIIPRDEALPPLPLREHLHELLLVVHAQLVVGVLAVELHGSLGDE